MDVKDISQSLEAFVHVDPWMIQVFIVVFASLLLDFVQKRVLRRLHQRLVQTYNTWDDAVIDAMIRPLSVLIWIVGLSFAAQIVHRATPAAIFEAVAPLRDVGVITTLTWFLVRLVTRAENNIVRAKERGGEAYDRTTVDAIGKLLRLSVVITAALITLQTLGFSISGVLAFGGIGGIAIGFAARDLLANFFGGLMLYLDRPFVIGEWVRSPDREIEGNVEYIGWRLTVIRTFDKRPLYIPNAAFSIISVENPSRMTNRRIYETVGIRYDDAAKMGAIVTDVKQMLREHEEIDQDKIMIVNFNTFAASSLDFFIYTFTKTTNWVRFHEVKEDVLLKVLDIIEAHGAEVAFPTSTVHIPGGIPEHVQGGLAEDDTLTAAGSGSR